MSSIVSYDLEDENIQCLSNRIEKLLDEKYKDEIEGVPKHIKRTLCQNFAISCKNKNMNIEELFCPTKITIH